MKPESLIVWEGFPTSIVEIPHTFLKLNHGSHCLDKISETFTQHQRPPLLLAGIGAGSWESWIKSTDPPAGTVSLISDAM
jgi:hypothetical protein